MENNKKTTYIKFFAAVVEGSVNALMQVVDSEVNKGVEKIVLLISTPGGSVHYGLSAYNYLKGIPVEVETHNFGSVDSVGVVLFCAGEKRNSVPHARFLLHGVQMNTSGPISLEEKQIEEKLKSLQIDIRNISKVIADTTNKDLEKIINDMLDRTTLNPDEAKKYGLVHDIKSELFPEGEKIISIQFDANKK